MYRYYRKYIGASDRRPFGGDGDGNCYAEIMRVIKGIEPGSVIDAFNRYSDRADDLGQHVYRMDQFNDFFSGTFTPSEIIFLFNDTQFDTSDEYFTFDSNDVPSSYASAEDAVRFHVANNMVLEVQSGNDFGLDELDGVMEKYDL